MEFWESDNLRNFNDFNKVRRLRLDGTSYPPSDWPITRALRNGIITQNEEVLHRRPQSTDIRICINAAPVRDECNKIIAAVATFHDVTELRSALDQQTILLNEINHRVKNTMATLQSIALLTRSGASSVDDYVSRFEKRLLALSRAYNLMTANNWRGANLRDIVATTVAPFQTTGQIFLQGPSVGLPARHTLAIAAALSELATNAAKYGALSTPEGRLTITWRLSDEKALINLSLIHISEPTRPY